jgi:excisionase family DNA binding protein
MSRAMLTTAEVGRLCRITRQQAATWARDKKVPAVRAAGGRWLFPREAVEEALTRRGDTRNEGHDDGD